MNKWVKIGISCLPLLFLAGPFFVCWNPLTTVIPHGTDHPYTPLVWPGVCVILAVAVISIAKRDMEWPARQAMVWTNVAVGGLATLMILMFIGLALNPT